MFIRRLGIALLVLALSGCEERPQRELPREENAALPAGASDPMRERTLRQGESGRIYP